MENIALIESFSEFKDDKLIDRVTLMAILEDVFRNALKKKYGEDDNFDIIVNPDKGDLEIWRNRIVVADGEVEDSNREISLAQARRIEPDFEVGEDVSEEVKLIDLGRRAILALRQNLISKIHEHDNTNIYKQFKDLEGEIYTAEVHHIRHRAIILLDDEGNEIVLPKDRQIPSVSLEASSAGVCSPGFLSRSILPTVLGPASLAREEETSSFFTSSALRFSSISLRSSSFSFFLSSPTSLEATFLLLSVWNSSESTS